jgi:hypothetical protein
MLVYPNIDILREFYCLYIRKEIEDYNGMVLIAPFYETIDSVRSTLSKYLPSFNISKYEKDQSLTITDARRFYNTPQRAVEYTTKMAKYAKSIGKTGVTVMGDMGVFFTTEYNNTVTDYEISYLPKEFSVDRKGFCLFNEKDVMSISPDKTIELFQHHGMIIELV